MSDKDKVLSNLNIPIFDIESFRNYALKLKLSGKVNFDIFNSSVVLESKDTLIFISHDEFIQVSLVGYNARQYLILNTSMSRLKVFTRDNEDIFNNVDINYLDSKEYMIFTSDKEIHLSVNPIYFTDLKFNGKEYKCYKLNDKVLDENGQHVDFILAMFGKSHRFALVTVSKNGIDSVDFAEAKLETRSILQ